MSDTPKEPEDDVFDDDFDLDAFDDEVEESLDDGEWDEFDDLPADGATESAEAGPADPAVVAPKKKSFFAKHFNAIVITIAVLGGGGWLALTQMAKAPEGAPQAQSQFPTASNEADDALPMPTPISSPETAYQDQEALPDAGEILTPMPEMAEDNTAPDTDLILPGDVAELPQEPAGETVDVAEDTGLALPDDPLSYDALIEEPVKEVAEVPALPVGEEETLGVLPDDILLPDDVGTAAPLAEESIPQAQNSLAQDTAPFAPAVDTSEIEGRLDTIEGRYDDLSNQISDTNEQIQDLSKAVKTLQSSLDKLAKAQSAAPVKVVQDTPETTTSTKKTQATAAPQKAPVKKPVLKTTPTVQPKADWVLRSAQPGLAVLLDQNTRNVQGVHVGDKVQGLGRITSISVESGLWVVRGTEGSISQK